MLSLQSAFLPVHPLDSNETTAQCLKTKCVKTMAKVSENSWCWKYHKEKETEEAKCTHNMEEVIQSRYSNVILSWRLQLSEEFHGEDWHRGYPTVSVKKELLTERRRLRGAVLWGFLFDLTLWHPTEWPVWFSKVFVDRGEELELELEGNT